MNCKNGIFDGAEFSVTGFSFDQHRFVQYCFLTNLSLKFIFADDGNVVLAIFAVLFMQ